MSNVKRNTELLIQTAKHGNAIEVERLIPLSTPNAFDSEALRWAARNGHTQCVQLLIPVSDPKVDNSLALRWAMYYNHNDCVDLLFDVSDVHVVLRHLQTDYPNDQTYWKYLEEKIAQRHRDVIAQEISEHSFVMTKQRKI